MYLNPVVSLYGEDGDGDGTTDAAVAAAQASLQQTAADAAAAAQNASTKTFTQEQVNEFLQKRLAQDRKNRQDEFRKLEQDYQNLLGTKALTEDERDSLTSRLEELQRANRTKEEQAKIEKRELEDKYKKRIEELEQRVAESDLRYETSTIERALMDAANKHDAYESSQIVTILKGHTKLIKPVDEQGNVLAGGLVPRVDLPDKKDDGESYISNRTPEDAVERLKVLMPNLFRANVASGVGGSSTTGGVTPGADGQIDVTKLSPEQYRELRAKDPAKVGRGRKSFR